MRKRLKKKLARKTANFKFNIDVFPGAIYTDGNEFRWVMILENMKIYYIVNPLKDTYPYQYSYHSCDLQRFSKWIKKFVGYSGSSEMGYNGVHYSYKGEK